MASRGQILTDDPEPRVDSAVEAVRALWAYVALRPECFHGYPGLAGGNQKPKEVHGTIVSWPEKVVGFRPDVFAKILRDAGLEPRDVKYALWARGWIERDPAGNFSVNLPVSRGGLRNTRFVVVLLGEAANEATYVPNRAGEVQRRAS